MSATINFFEAQDRARRNTVWLVLAFVAAIASLIAGLYFLVFYFFNEEPRALTLDIDLLINISLAAVAVVFAGTLYKILALGAGGGAAIAQQLGGQLVSTATRDANERRLINIVGEMALAAGCPPPQLYVLPDKAINAFAAGSKPGNAVIGVTQGTLVMPRDQLQGIIAHEFSHIINGDMGINIRLIGIIHGLMLFYYLGYSILIPSPYYYRSSSKGRGQAMMMGLGLMVIGGLSAFFGNLIRAAVSRQREFLADAAAVQFTRNPEGIGGALQSIAAASSQLVENPKANECAHLFFSQGIHIKLFSGMLASHPPLGERIKRILPKWDGKISEQSPVTQSADSAVSQLQSHAPSASASVDSSASVTAAATDSISAAAAQKVGQDAPAETPLPDLFAMVFERKVAVTAITENVGHANHDSLAAGAALMSLPPILEEALADSYSARALVYAILLDESDGAQQQVQLQHLESFAEDGVYELVKKIMAEAARLPHAARLPLLLRALPALRLLSPRQYQLFRKNMAALIAADGKVNVLEWSVQAAIMHHLQDCFGALPSPPSLGKRRAWESALSVLARAGSDDDAEAAFLRVTSGMNLSYDASEFSAEKMSAAMRELSHLGGKNKKIFMDAAAAVAAADNILSGDEIVLLRAFAILLDCPLPLAL